MKDRMDVVDYILNEYCARHRRQEDIANELILSTKQVGMVTREGNYSHTIYKDVNNLKEGQIINMISFYGSDKFDFLDNVILPKKINDESYEHE